MSEEVPPPAKRLHLASDENALSSSASVSQKDEQSLHLLGERLKSVLQCTVCQDVPHPEDVCQCPWGHIMCESCVLHLMADATLRQRTARCPHCRRQLTFKDVTRNLPLKQAMWELPTDCRQCKQTYEFKNIDHHVQEECPERQVDCKYSCIGCKWQGAYNVKQTHEAECEYPMKSAREILIEVQEKDNREKRATRGLRLLYDQLSALRFFTNDLELRLHNLGNADRIFFDSQRFYAFEDSWMIRVRINDCGSSEEDVSERKMSYSMMLMSEPRDAIKVHFFLTKTPRVPLRIGAHVYKHAFNSSRHSSGFKKMRLADANECNRLLALKSMWVRVWMFLN